VHRFFKQYLLLLALNQMSSALFRFIAGIGRDMVVSHTFGPLSLLAFAALGGFILARRKLLDSLSIIACSYMYLKLMVLNANCS
jgi:ABC-type multidrug transport system permease subunit